MTGCSFHYFLASLGAPRHRDQRRGLVGNQLVANQITTPRHHVQDSLRQSRLIREPNQFDSTQRRIARWFGNHSVSRYECWGDLPRNHRGRKVPWSYRCNYAKWKFENHYCLSRIIAWKNVSLYPPSKFSIIFEILSRPLYLQTGFK